MSYFFRIFLALIIICNINLNLSPNSALAVDKYVKTLAVLDFDNNTGLMSLDNLKKGLSDTLTNNLARYKTLTIVERARLKDAMQELSLSQTAFVSPDTAVKIGKVTGSQYVMLGSVTRVGEIYEVGLRIVDVESSRVILGKSVRCTNEEAILQSVDYLALEAANSLGEPVNKQALETARHNAEAFTGTKADLTWLWWVGGGVLVLAAVGAVLAVTLGGGKQTNNQSVCIGSNCGPANNTDTTTSNANNFNFSGFKFGVGF